MHVNEDHIGRDKIKDAASLIIRGGSLISEPCSKCGGVQVKSGSQSLCVNCGNNQTPLIIQNQQEVKEKETPDLKQNTVNTHKLNLKTDPQKILEQKIIDTILSLDSEHDSAILLKKAELIEQLLRILEKTRQLIY